LVSQTISHYRIIRKLGAGGMGDVYLAQDSQLDRQIAIKILPERSISDEKARRRLVQEARAAAKLDHPNICAIHEVGEDSGNCYIAMQYIEGETLAEKIRNGALAFEQALDISIQISDALREAHSHGIVHRDIKPQNIIVTPRGLVKVLDFGLAKLVQETSSESGAETASMMTAPGSIVGTLAYMSPEQLRAEVVDQRTDIFSLGAVIYEMLSGRGPFRADTAPETAAHVLMKDPPALGQLALEIPDAFPGIVERALAKKREDRYQTANDLLDDLLELKEHQTASRSRDYLVRESISSAKADAPTSAISGISVIETSERRGSPGGSNAIRALLVHKKKIVIAGFALVVTALGAHFLNLDRALWSRNPVTSIAVLPFTFSGLAPEDEYLTEGLTDSLIRRLSQLTNLKVIASSSVSRYKDLTTIEPRAIRKELNVGAIVTTKVVSRGDMLTLNVELVDTEDASIIWAGTFTSSRSGMASLPIDMSRLISTRLQLKLSGQDVDRMSRRQTADPDAYANYLEGRYYCNKRMGGALRKAIEKFQRAVEIDPKYAMAYAGIAESWVLGGNVSAPPSEYMGKAKDAALTALKLDESLAEAHAVLAMVKFQYDWDWAGAAEEFKRAIDLNPSYATAHEWYATLLMATGKPDEASAILRQAYELDPMSMSINTSLALPFFYAGQYEQAESILKQALQKDSGFLQAHFDLGISYAMSGQPGDAIAEFERVRTVAPNYYPAIAMTGFCYARQGRKTDAEKVLEQLLTLSKERHISTYNLVVIYIGLGDIEKALDWLWKGYQERAAYLSQLKVDPLFAKLRNHPRYQSLVSEMKLP
jgi:serine/threonine-protein kinase